VPAGDRTWLDPVIIVASLATSDASASVVISPSAPNLRKTAYFRHNSVGKSTVPLYLPLDRNLASVAFAACLRATTDKNASAIFPRLKKTSVLS
jgi:hypothetical protein